MTVPDLYLATGDLTRAEECVQEAYLRAWQRWSHLDTHVHDPLAWVRTVAWRLAANDWRRLTRSLRALVRHGPLLDAPPPSADVLAVRDALTRLPMAQRTVLVLHYYDDLPVREIAVVLDVPDGLVWPAGFSARRGAQGVVEVVDPGGTVVVRAGDSFSVSGGMTGPSMDICGVSVGQGFTMHGYPAVEEPVQIEDQVQIEDGVLINGATRVRLPAGLGDPAAVARWKSRWALLVREAGSDADSLYLVGSTGAVERIAEDVLGMVVTPGERWLVWTQAVGPDSTTLAAEFDPNLAGQRETLQGLWRPVEVTGDERTPLVLLAPLGGTSQRKQWNLGSGIVEEAS